MKKNIKKGLSLIMATLMCLAVMPMAVLANPSAASGWAQEPIAAAIEAGLVPQSLRSNYTAATTRAEFAALAVALYETGTGAQITGRMQFNDTNDINVQKMGYLGVVTGTGGDNFSPNSPLTREQAATMLARLADAMDRPLAAQRPTFADNSAISSWAFDAVGQVQAAGIMGGVGNNAFSPAGAYTREQSIVTMHRLYTSLSSDPASARPADMTREEAARLLPGVAFFAEAPIVPDFGAFLDISLSASWGSPNTSLVFQYSNVNITEAQLTAYGNLLAQIGFEGTGPTRGVAPGFAFLGETIFLELARDHQTVLLVGLGLGSNGSVVTNAMLIVR